MNKSITQDMAYRQSLMKYAEKYGVSRASRKYNKSRSYIYFWKQRWDGSAASLACQSRRPHSHPNQHTEAERKLIRDMRRRNPTLGMIELWHRLRQRGYTRCPESLFRVMRKMGLFPAEKPKNTYKPKPYEQMAHPGERVQVDVKVRSALLYHESGASPVPVHRHRRIYPSAVPCRLSGAFHLFFRGFPSQTDRMVCTPRHPGRMRPDGQRLRVY